MVYFYATLTLALAQEPVISGPQVGESITPFKVKLVLGDKSGKETQFANAAHEGPQVLIFVHRVVCKFTLLLLGIRAMNARVVKSMTLRTINCLSIFQPWDLKHWRLLEVTQTRRTQRRVGLCLG